MEESDVLNALSVADEGGKSYSLWARELNNLSQSEREDVFNDIHGVPSLIVEESNYLQEKYRQFENALARELAREEEINTEERGSLCEAYKQALLIDPSYVQDSDLRLAFLRAESFDHVRTARRYLTFFREKLELFGPSLLCRKITLRDLDSADLRVLESGRLQLLPQRDKAGRKILCKVENSDEAEHSISVVRHVSTKRFLCVLSQQFIFSKVAD